MLNVISSQFMPIGDDGIELGYRYFPGPGTAPVSDGVLVFIHAHSVDCRMWEPQIEHFAGKRPIIVYDLRGYGQSSMPKEGQDYLHAEDLHLLLRKLGIERIHLIGLSLGAFVALDYFALYPDQVRSVVVSGGAVPEPLPAKSGPLVTDVASFKRKWYEDVLQSCGPDKNGYRSRLWSMIRDWQAWQSTHREPECLLRDRLLPRLHHASPVPMLAIQGDRDSEGAHHSVQKLLNSLEHASHVTLENAGHFCNLEVPEVFNRELQAFLDYL